MGQTSLPTNMPAMIDARDMPLLTSVQARYGLADPALVQALLDRVETVTLPRGEVLMRAGSAVEGFYIIAEGLVRYFYVTSDGKERNKAFFRESQFIGSLSAYLTQQSVPFTIQALEPCRMYRISLGLLDTLKAEHEAATERWISAIARELFVRNEQREAVLLTANAEQRYNWMLAHEGWLVERVPQYQLASYLGMDPVSLSRLKKKST